MLTMKEGDTVKVSGSLGRAGLSDPLSTRRAGPSGYWTGTVVFAPGSDYVHVKIGSTRRMVPLAAIIEVA